jgi:hypothetical protein
MKIEKFEMERMQCMYEREVEFNLSESGVLPMRLSELLDGVVTLSASSPTSSGIANPKALRCYVSGSRSSI